jgi:thiol:disulfide interchange protein
MCCTRRSLTVVLFLALAFGAGVAMMRASSNAPATQPSVKVAGLDWHTTLNQALEAAQRDHRLVLVDVYADWCGWCHKLDQETFAAPAVQEKLREFTLLKLDADRYGDVTRRYGVEGLPTTLVLTEKGDVVARQVGFMGPDDYLAFLKQVMRNAPA